MNKGIDRQYHTGALLMAAGGLMAVFFGPLYPWLGLTGGFIGLVGAAVAIHAEFRRR